MAQNEPKTPKSPFLAKMAKNDDFGASKTPEKTPEKPPPEIWKITLFWPLFEKVRKKRLAFRAKVAKNGVFPGRFAKNSPIKKPTIVQNDPRFSKTRGGATKINFLLRLILILPHSAHFGAFDKRGAPPGGAPGALFLLGQLVLKRGHFWAFLGPFCEEFPN